MPLRRSSEGSGQVGARRSSAARSVSPTATSGRNTACMSPSGATCTTRRSMTWPRATVSRSCIYQSRGSSPRLSLGFDRTCEARSASLMWSMPSIGSRMASSSCNRSIPTGRSRPPIRSPNCGLHGALFIGPRRRLVASDRPKLAANLSALRISLYRDGEPVDRGVGANALDGPVEALSHLVKVLEKDRLNPPLRAGEIVTTGTLTRAFPVSRGERWSTVVDGLELPGLAVEIG